MSIHEMPSFRVFSNKNHEAVRTRPGQTEGSRSGSTFLQTCKQGDQKERYCESRSDAARNSSL